MSNVPQKESSVVGSFVELIKILQDIDTSAPNAKINEQSIDDNMADKLKAADVFQKDAIVSNLFLKLCFDNQKMTQYTLKEPFASLVELYNIQYGGGGWNRTNYQVVMSRLL